MDDGFSCLFLSLKDAGDEQSLSRYIPTSSNLTLLLYPEMRNAQAFPLATGPVWYTKPLQRI